MLQLEAYNRVVLSGMVEREKVHHQNAQNAPYGAIIDRCVAQPIYPKIIAPGVEYEALVCVEYEF